MNIVRLTVMSLRVLTSRTTPRWSVNVFSESVVLRYRTCVFRLNFIRKGTVASSGVCQITIPSWYRSMRFCFAGAAALEDAAADGSAGAAASGLAFVAVAGRLGGGCPWA